MPAYGVAGNGDLPPMGRQGPASFLALIGALWAALSVYVVLRWVTDGTQFGPVERIGPDEMASWRVAALRVFELVSLAVMFGFFWWSCIKPWRETGRISLDGKFVIGGLVGFTADAFLNVHNYLFAWNSHNVNLGVWVKYLPFHNPDAPSQYGESLIWGPPMYIYFCAGVAILAAHHAVKLRRRWPKLSKFQIFVAIFVFEFWFDFIIENLAIRLTHGYAYAKTYEPLTLWAGEVHQFPVYESVLVAFVGMVFTWARMEAMERPPGQSPIEIGVERWRASLQGVVGHFAVYGFCVVTLVFVYHLPFNWLGTIGDSYADLPSYLMPSECEGIAVEDCVTGNFDKP
ncbi:hypothetical protein ASE01_14460 [Nocardioides sp. Root190]|nr:hypothetical protein ASE01_14460 [Nocardioides sp. Root190]